ncbi:uncharacterized protein LOC62_07G009184 [Vanrija pseudolonga]|uniref:Mating factor alpha n=1 Tax=Vanrija pseudolonga TaxID=143232 RepID=A0AAF0YL66_9TREE|nr:hypothetical protein LOC62_07G009184 [Vanrija pseudolonga]
MKPVLITILAAFVAGVVAVPVPVLLPPTTDLDVRQIWGGNPPYWKREAGLLPTEMAPLLYRGHEDVADDPGDEKHQDGYWRDASTAEFKDTRIYWKRDWPTGGWWFPGPVFWKHTADASATPDAQTGIWGGAPPHWKRNPDAEAGPTSTSNLDARQCGGIWGGSPAYWKREPGALITATSS